MELGLRGIPTETLPIAMLRLENGTLRWLDPYLVRRDISAARNGVVGLGVTPRALREAHLLQYEQQLREIVAERQRGGGLRFAATDYFEVLPPTGHMPAAAIDTSDFSQIFFPPSMTVLLTVVPDDEIPTLLEQSQLFSPIQVAGKAEDLDFTTIHVLIPAPRQSLRALRPHSVRRVALPPTLPSLRRPTDILNRLTRRTSSTKEIVPTNDPIAAQWRQMLTSQKDGLLWFARRRSVPLTVTVGKTLQPTTAQGRITP